MNEIDEHGVIDVTVEDWKNIHIGSPAKLVSGATLNNLLRSQFILFSSNQTAHDSRSSSLSPSPSLLSSLPGGVECWSEICETVFIMLQSMCTAQQIFRRVFVLILRSLTVSSNPRNSTDKDLAYGALIFLTIWIQHFQAFIPQSNILEMHFLLLEYLDYLKTIGFSKETIKRGGIGVNLIEKLYDLHEIFKRRAIPLPPNMFNFKNDYLKGTWNVEEEKKLRSMTTKKAFGEEKKKGTMQVVANKGKTTAAASVKPVINVFGVTPDMLDDDGDDDWDLPPPPLLLTSHLTGNGINDEPNEPEKDQPDDPMKYYPIPRIIMGTTLLQDSFQTDLWSFDLLEIARQWTLLDHRNYLAIPLSSYYNCEWSLPRHQQVAATTIRHFIDQFNSQSAWVTEQIIMTSLLEKRVQLISKFVELAVHLEALNNFNGVMAILTGLQQGCVSRLKEMMKSLDDQTSKQLHRLQGLMSGLKNYQQYREVLTLRAAGFSSDVEDWTYKNYSPQDGYTSGTHDRRISNRFIPSLDGVCAVVPHLGAHLAELTSISEGNSTYLSDAPHLLNMEKKRLFARCLSQLRRLNGMKYHLHSLRLIQGILCREFQKAKHLSSQSSSDWSRRMYQLSLELDKKEEDDDGSDTEEELESPLRFTRPTLTKAKSLLGGSWSARRFSTEAATVNAQDPVEATTTTEQTFTKPPLATSKSTNFRNGSVIDLSSTPSAPAIQSNPSSLPVQNTTLTSIELNPKPEKKKSLKNLINALPFGKKKSSQSDGVVDQHIDQSSQNLAVNTTPPKITKETRKMLL